MATVMPWEDPNVVVENSEQNSVVSSTVMPWEDPNVVVEDTSNKVKMPWEDKSVPVEGQVADGFVPYYFDNNEGSTLIESKEQEKALGASTREPTKDEWSIINAVREDRSLLNSKTKLKLSATPDAERKAIAESFISGSKDTLDGIMQYFWEPAPVPIYDSNGDFTGKLEEKNEEEKKAEFYSQSAVAERHAVIDLYREQYGGKITAANFAGMILDPSGVLVAPLANIKKADTLRKRLIKGAPVAAILGGTGYEHEDGWNRWQNAAAAMVGQQIFTGGIAAFKNTLGPVISKNYKEFVSEPIWKTADKFYQHLQTSPKTKPTMDSFGRWFIDNYGLDPSYVVSRKSIKVGTQNTLGDFLSLFNKTLDLNDDEQAMMYLMATGRASKELNGNLSNITKEGMEMIDNLGQELVRLGALPEKVYLKNKGKYMHRSYANTDASASTYNGLKNPSDVYLLGDALKGRGVTEDISVDKLDDYIAKGWEKRGNTSSKSGKVKVWRDYTTKELQDMGEMHHFGYALLETGRLMGTDVGYFRHLDNIAKNDKWASKTEQEGWLQLPKASKISKSNTNRWGNLAGMWVEPNIHRDLKAQADIQKLFEGNALGRSYMKMQTLWKRAHTSLNLTTHMNNATYNFSQYDHHSGNWSSLASSAKEMIMASKTGVLPDDFKLATKLGVFNADQSSNELNQHLSTVLSAYLSKGRLNPDKGEGNTLDKIFNHSLRVGKSLKNVVIGKGGFNKTHLDALYQAEDNVFRLGLFKTRLKAGDTPTEAAMYSRKYMLDYEINAPGIDILRKTVHPFLAFAYRAIPTTIEGVIDKPWKMAKYASMIYAYNKYGELDAPADLITDERADLDELEKGSDFFGIDSLNLLVRSAGPPSELGSEYRDISHKVLLGDVLQSGSGALDIPGIPLLFQPQGAAIGEIGMGLVGFDAFTRKGIPGTGTGDWWSDGMPGTEITARAKKIMQGFLPPWLGGHAWDKWQAASDPQQEYSKQDFTKEQGIKNLIGDKLYNFQPRKVKQQIIYKYQKKEQAYADLINKQKNLIMSRSNKADVAEAIKKIQEYSLKKIDVKLEMSKALTPQSYKDKK